MLPIVQQVAKEYKESLQNLYGDELVELILFGSYARGDARPDSDVDLLVVANTVDGPRRESVRLRQALRGLGVPIDVL